MENPGPISTAIQYRQVSSVRFDPNEDEVDGPCPFGDCPEGVLIKVFIKLSISDLKSCRLTCSKWNSIILLSELLDLRSCFLFDGRKDDSVGNRIADYISNSPEKNYYWSHLKLRCVSGRQTGWINNELEVDSGFGNTVSKLELLNCSVNWSIILQVLIYLPNLTVFIDTQDMYRWDYQTFNSGIDEDEIITENLSYIQLHNIQNLDNLAKLKIVRVHRSQLVECTTYLKMFLLRTNQLKELEMTTDQNFAPQRAASFYTHLFDLLRQNRTSLKQLKFPYKLVCPTYDFRVMDEHHCFREFINFLADRRWAETLKLEAIENLHLQFGIIPVDNQDMRQKLVPFLKSMPTLRRFTMGCLLMESGMERFVDEFLRDVQQSPFQSELGVYINDAAGSANITNFEGDLRSLSIQTFRDTAKQLKELVPMLGVDLFENLKELQYFSKNHSFRNFNFDLLCDSFTNLTQLNLVDHNSRLETRHSCEALATIEDDDMQLITSKLGKLESIQLITNMTYLTDSGLTGISVEGCKKMKKANLFQVQNEWRTGKPMSNLKNLKYLVLRGLGIKVTDVSAHFAFNDMPLLRKLHIHGCHQISASSRSMLSQKFNSTNGCDLQIGPA